MTELNLLSISHIIIVVTCLVGILYIPKYFENSSKSTHQLLAYGIIFFIAINQGMDFYREGYLDEWKLGLPLHLCDFSSFAVVVYLLTKRRDFFLFAFFFGILGGGAAAAISQGEGRRWAIPLGIVSGSVIGCDIDGG